MVFECILGAQLLLSLAISGMASFAQIRVGRKEGDTVHTTFLFPIGWSWAMVGLMEQRSNARYREPARLTDTKDSS